MIRYKDLSIPEPCTFLNTTKESKVDNAYFCSHCDKKVYDFRNKKETYLNEINSQTKGDFCGVYYEDQIRTYIPPIKTPNFFQRIKQYSILYLTTAFSFVQQHSGARDEIAAATTVQVDQDSTQKFHVTTKEGKKYLDSFDVYIYINDKFYKYKGTTDSTTIYLPDTIDIGDEIVIKTHKFRSRYDWGRRHLYFRKRTHVIKKSFKYKGEEWIEISAKEKKYLVIHFLKRRHSAGVMMYY